MLIYYNTWERDIKVITLENQDKFKHILRNIVRNFKLFDYVGDLDFEEKINIIYVHEYTSMDVDKSNLIFFLIKESGQQEKPTFVIIDDLAEPRDLNKSVMLHTSIRKGVDPKNILSISASEYGVCKYDIRHLKLYGQSLHFFKIKKDNILIGEDIDKVIKKDKLLCSFNRRPTQQRVMQTISLINRFDSSDLMVSLCVDNSPIPNWVERYVDFFCEKELVLPIIVDHENLLPDDPEQFTLTHLNSRDCLFEVVNETIGASPDGEYSPNFLHENVKFMSEKSFRPFLNHQIPILSSTKGFSKWVESTFGLDLFKDIIDYTKWDEICILSEKVNAITDSLMSFKQFYPDYTKFYEDNIERFKKNEKIVKSLIKNKNILHYD